MLSAPPRQRDKRPIRRLSNPGEWGNGMSVCIAAICNSEAGPSSVIVTASDQMVTWGTYSSSESALKAARLAPRWMTMIAGDDVTLGVEDVIRHTRATLATYEDEPPSVLQAQSSLLAAWRDAQNQLGQAAVLNPYRLTVDEFVRNGRQRFGDTKFLELATQLEVSSRLRCQLLAAGFDANKIPALLACDDESGCRDYTRADFLAIGTGHTTAIANMAFHEYTRDTDLESAIYQVCAAKFMAERAPGVGKHTLVLCLRDDGKTKWIFKTHIKQIRQFWEERGRPQIPPKADINAVLTPITDHQQWLEF